jgi:hypothetical protein
VVRPYAAVILVLFGAGSSLTRPLRNLDVVLRLALTVGLSLACSVLTAQVLLATHNMHATPAAVVLTALTGIGLFILPKKRRVS